MLLAIVLISTISPANIVSRHDSCHMTYVPFHSQSTLSALHISRDLANALENPDFQDLRGVVEAARKLHALRQRVTRGSPTCIPPHLLHLRVVAEAQQRMDGLAQRFVTKATAMLSTLLNHVSDCSNGPFLVVLRCESVGATIFGNCDAVDAAQPCE